MPLKCLIIDEDRSIHHLLIETLSQFFPDFKILPSAFSGSEAVKIMHQYNPDLVFLDTEMEEISGSALLYQLNELSKNKFKTILTAEDSEFAIHGLPQNGFVFLPKPVDTRFLFEIVKKFIQDQEGESNLRESTLAKQPKNVLRLQLQKGDLYVPFEDILYLQGDRNYTNIYALGRSKILISKTLSYFEEQLDMDIFFRCHKSFIINRQHINYSLEDNRIIVDQETKIPVARRKKTQFLNWFEESFN